MDVHVSIQLLQWESLRSDSFSLTRFQVGRRCLLAVQQHACQMAQACSDNNAAIEACSPVTLLSSTCCAMALTNLFRQLSGKNILRHTFAIAQSHVAWMPSPDHLVMRASSVLHYCPAAASVVSVLTCSLGFASCPAVYSMILYSCRPL
jgi:hypothetical protein